MNTNNSYDRFKFFKSRSHEEFILSFRIISGKKKTLERKLDDIDQLIIGEFKKIQKLHFIRIFIVNSEEEEEYDLLISGTADKSEISVINQLAQIDIFNKVVSYCKGYYKSADLVLFFEKHLEPPVRTLYAGVPKADVSTILTGKMIYEVCIDEIKLYQNEQNLLLSLFRIN